MPTPLLILSDAPTSGTGLGRITCDLATRIAKHMPDVFEVGTAGYGGPYSRALPFPQYNIEMGDWVVHNLPEIWSDFAGDRKGVLMTIWDASRMLWFARPENCLDPRLKKFLDDPPFQRWGYFPIDATGIHDKLTVVLKHTIEGYDRVLAYSKWAEDILRRTLWKKPLLDTLTNLPHGIDTSVFQPRDRAIARAEFGKRIGARTQKGTWLTIPDKALFVGIVATNQMRKDWGLGIATVAELAKERDVMLWCHIDELERHWSIPALLNDFRLLQESVVTTIPLSDEQLSYCYSACDVTLGIGMGEGYGFCLFESLACGTPVVHGNYGGAAEHLPDEMLIWPSDAPLEVPMRLEGPYNCYRPVYDPREWAQVAARLAQKDAVFPAHLDWNNLWERWQKWFKDGLA